MLVMRGLYAERAASIWVDVVVLSVAVLVRGTRQRDARRSEPPPLARSSEKSSKLGAKPC